MKAKRSLLLGSVLLAATPILHAADGTYISQTGDWNDVGSWDSGIIADGAGFTAFFTNDVLADSTTVLGEDRAIGNITFSDADNSAGNGFDRTISGNVLTLAGTTPTLSVTQSDRTLTIGSEIAGTEGLTKAGVGTLILSSANTYTGGTSITAGTLKLSGSGSLGAAGASVAVSSGALLDLNGTNQSIAFTAGTGVGTVANNSGGGTSILTLSAAPSASSILIADNTNSSSGKVAVVIATNTQTLSGSNTYSGGTTVNAGAWLGNLGTNAGTGAISLTAANSGVWTNVNVSVANDITGAGFVSINQNASGTLTLTGNLTNTGNYTFHNTNVLQTYNFAGNGTTSTLSGVIGGPGGVNGGGGTTAARAGSIIKSGTGLLTLSGNNVYFGNTTISGGILRIAHNNALGTAANGTTVSGNTLSGRLELQGGIAVAGETLTLAGRQGIAASAPALSNFSGNNSWGGNINLIFGGLEYNIESQADTLTIAGNINPGTTTGDRFLNFMGDGHTNVTGQILAGSAATVVLTKTGGGTLTLTNTNAYTGATNVNAGTLHIGATGSTHANSAVTVSNSGSALIVNGTINGTLNANSSTTVSGSGTIVGAATISGNLNPGTSPGVLSFSNNLTLSGSTTNLEILGLNRGTDYDGVNVSGVLAYGGILNLAFGTIFGSDEVFNLFDLFTGTSGTFSEVNLTGDYATTLTNNSGVWTGTTNLGNQSWSFAQSTGDLTLTVIPEPSAALLGGLGALLLLRRRR